MSGEGGFVTSRLDEAIGWARKYSIFQYPFVTACCGMEYMATACSHYDVDRFGAGLPRFSPRQADVLFVVGTISHKMAPVLKRIYDQMAEPKWVVSFGVCTCTGGFYDNYATVMGIDTIIPVDVYIPGCPPRPEYVLDGLLKLQAQNRRAACHWPAPGAGTQAGDAEAGVRAMNAASLIQAVRDRFPDAVTASHAFRGDATVIVARDDPARGCAVAQGRCGLPDELADGPDGRGLFRLRNEAVARHSFPRPAWRCVRHPRFPTHDPWPGPPADARFAVVYHFFSLPLKHRLRVEVLLQEDDPEVDSVTSLWAGADWLEREVWDMFGIRFRGHPNLKRILMYDEFVGHPLRKDYPVNRRQPLIGPVN